MINLGVTRVPILIRSSKFTPTLGASRGTLVNPQSTISKYIFASLICERHLLRFPLGGHYLLDNTGSIRFAHRSIRFAHLRKIQSIFYSICFAHLCEK